MPLDSSSDKRFNCRECGKPRLRAVALLPPGVRRAQLLAQPLCFDVHPAEVARAEFPSGNPLLTTVDLTCPQCKGIVNINPLTDNDQTEACEDCGQLYTVIADHAPNTDGSRSLRWKLRADAPPNASEVEGDLRFHERN